MVEVNTYNLLSTMNILIRIIVILNILVLKIFIIKQCIQRLEIYLIFKYKYSYILISYKKYICLEKFCRYSHTHTSVRVIIINVLFLF